MEQDTEIGSDASGTPVDPHDSASGTPSGENQTHYKTLTEADADARKFQSRADKAEAELARWKQNLGGRLGPDSSPETIGRLVDQAIEVASRPDWNDYRAGNLSKKAEEEEDEFLTDDQKEIRDLKRQLGERDTQSRNQQGQVNGELSVIRFERAEKEIQAQLGDNWTRRRERVLGEVQRIVASGAVRSLDAVNEKLLFKAWAASFDDPKEFKEAMTKWVLDSEAQRTASINGKSTLPPNSLAPGSPATAPPKNWTEVIERANRDLREQGFQISDR